MFAVGDLLIFLVFPDKLKTSSISLAGNLFYPRAHSIIDITSRSTRGAARRGGIFPQELL